MAKKKTIANRSTTTQTKPIEYKESAFRGHIEMSFFGIDGTDNAYELDPKRITYIMFNYEYFDKEIPIVVVSMSVPVKIYSNIIDNQETAKVRLKILFSNPLSNSSIPKVSMEHTFSYITVNQTQPYIIKTDNTEQTHQEETYRTMYIGLVDKDMTKYLRKPFNGVYRNTSLQGLLSIAMAGYKGKYIIEPFKYDHKYKQVIVPGCTTRQKFLEFLFDYDKFYDDYFNLFIDFDTVYLTSQSGNGGGGGADNKSNIIIDVRTIDDPLSFKDGYTQKADSIYIYTSQMDVAINTNTATDNIVNKVVSYGERREPESYAVSEGDRVIFNRSGSSDEPSNNAANQIKSSSTIIELTKNNIPDDIFEPDRLIMVKMYDDYEKYSGKYRLYYKRVFYKSIGEDEFLVNVNIGLIGSPGTTSKKKSTTSKKKNTAISKSARKKSSSDNESNAVSRTAKLEQYVDDEEYR